MKLKGGNLENVFGRSLFMWEWEEEGKESWPRYGGVGRESGGGETKRRGAQRKVPVLETQVSHAYHVRPTGTSIFYNRYKKCAVTVQVFVILLYFSMMATETRSGITI